MIRNVLSHIGGVEVYGIISILLFFAFFAGMLVWAFGLKSSHLQAMSRLPLRDGEPGADDATDTTHPVSTHRPASRPSHERE